MRRVRTTQSIQAAGAIAGAALSVGLSRQSLRTHRPGRTAGARRRCDRHDPNNSNIENRSTVDRGSDRRQDGWRGAQGRWTAPWNQAAHGDQAFWRLPCPRRSCGVPDRSHTRGVAGRPAPARPGLPAEAGHLPLSSELARQVLEAARRASDVPRTRAPRAWHLFPLR